MNKAVYVGLSGPTYYDYQNHAQRTCNDITPPPNPILENAFGLAVFYKEIWFLCESLCPQSLRGHPSVRYVDKIPAIQNDLEMRAAIAEAISNTSGFVQPDDTNLIRTNFDQYWSGVKRAGVYWWEDKKRAIDNHTHVLDILGVQTYASSNTFIKLHIDLQILELLRKVTNIDIALNTFSRNLHKVLSPSGYHPNLESSGVSNLGAFIINAKISNAISTTGPTPELFDKIAGSKFVTDFRNYLASKDFADAEKVYSDVANEIDESVKAHIRKAALNARPIRGAINLAIDAALDYSGVSTAQKLTGWYAAAITPSPIGAAAFMLDLES